MTVSFLDGVRFTAAAAGTGSFTVSAAVQGYQTPIAAGVTDGATYRYRAESRNLSQWEIGTAVYSSSGGTFSRSVISSSSGGTVNFTNPPEVAITIASADFAALQPLDATVTALAALDSSAGFVTQTGADTFSKTAIGTGVDTFITTPSSDNLRAALTDETGTGAAVFATSPTLVTPALGTPASGVMTNVTGLPISTGVSGLGTGIATALAVNTGSAGAPVLFNGAGGTPSSLTLTSATGLPVATGISGLGAGVATFLATPSSANLATALTDETGTAGSVVFSASPTLTGTITAAAANFSGTITFGTGTITGLTNKASPNSTDDYVIIYDAAGTAIKKATVGSVGSAGAVSSIDGATGAFTISAPLTRSSQNLTVSAATASATGVIKRPRMAIVRQEAVSGSNGGDFTSGADRTRTIDTEVSDLDGILTLASNQFTLVAGTYLIQWTAPAYKVDSHQSFLYNVTDTTEVKRGTPEYCGSGAAIEVITRSVGRAIVTIASSKAFEIRHRGQTTKATTGFGFGASFGTEVFTEVVIQSYDQ